MYIIYDQISPAKSTIISCIKAYIVIYFVFYKHALFPN